MIFDSDGERCMPTDVQVIVRLQKRLATVSITLPAEEQFRTLLEAVRSTHPAEMDSPCPIGFLLGANENGLGGYVVSLDQSLSSVGITPRTHVVGERIMLKYYIVTGMVGTPTKKDPERAELILNLHDHGNLWCEPEDPGITLEQGLGALAFTDKIESDRKQERKAWRESLKKEAQKPAAQEWTPWNTSRTGSRTTGPHAPRQPGRSQSTRANGPSRTTGHSRTTGPADGRTGHHAPGRSGSRTRTTGFETTMTGNPDAGKIALRTGDHPAVVEAPTMSGTARIDMTGRPDGPLREPAKP